MNENIRSKLTLLLEQGSVSKSACSGALLKFLTPLLESGVVIEDRVGAGRRLMISDVATFQQFFELQFPDAICAQELPSRISSVARFRDSKVTTADTPDIVLVRAWSDSILWKNHAPVSAAVGSFQHGVFSFVIRPQSPYEIRGSCALVENPAMLLNFERLGLIESIPIAIYAGGRVAGRVLRWLAAMSHPDFRLTHFPDYDPVGLSEFVRVRSALGTRATLHMPATLEANFARFANTDLLRRKASQLLLPALRATALPEIHAVLTLIERHNAGLEQEALLL